MHRPGRGPHGRGPHRSAMFGYLCREIRTMRPIFAALLATALASACASEPRAATTFAVVEQNATIPNRHAIRRTSIIDNDVLLVETRPNNLFRVELFPNCVNRTDMARPIRIQSTG